MRPPSDILERFRTLLAPPGPAVGRVAPPDDVGSQLRAELAPILAAVDRIETEAVELSRTSRMRVDAVVADAEQQAAALIAAAEEGASEARSRAASIRTHEIDNDIAAKQAAARVEADRVQEKADAALPALVSRVVACVESYGGGSL
jgi:hypothetical protein